MNELITTTEAAKIAGVGVSSIKRWANQSLIEVVRTPGGHRRVVKANLMRFLSDAGSPSRNPGSSQYGLLDGAMSNDAATSESESHVSPGVKWANCILGGDVHAIQSGLLQARSRLGSWFPAADEACLGLREIGLRWVRGETNILDEHVASERLSRSLAMIAESMPTSPENPVCVLACAEKDSHTLGLSFLQLCLREAGWHPLWVGANTPIEYICDAMSAEEVRMAAISASSSSSDAVELSDYATRLEECCMETDTLLVLGGSGAWPATLDIAYRLNSFSGLRSLLQGFK